MNTNNDWWRAWGNTPEEAWYNAKGAEGRGEAEFIQGEGWIPLKGKRLREAKALAYKNWMQSSSKPMPKAYTIDSDNNVVTPSGDIIGFAGFSSDRS